MKECVQNMVNPKSLDADKMAEENGHSCIENNAFILELSQKIDVCSEYTRELVSAIMQVDTDIHMVNDSIDVISDTSDTIYGVTEFMKKKTEELIECSDYHRKEAQDVIEGLCDILEALNSVKDQVADISIKDSLSEIIRKSEGLTELLSDKVEPGYEDFTEVADNFNNDIEMIEGAICDFVNMSHDIQNVVRVIADSMDEIVDEANRTSETIDTMSKDYLDMIK